jgi:hypothetical protein
MAKKYLIVGANTDSEQSNLPSLPGAKNTAFIWEGFLKKQGFSGECLTDGKADGIVILKKLKELFSTLDDGDLATFIYLGHGTRIKNQNFNPQKPDETDGYDEVLYCNGNTILDDDIREALNLNKRKAPVFVVIDACKSGVVESNFELLNNLNEYNEIAFSATNQGLESYYLATLIDADKKANFSLCLLEVLEADNLDKNYNEIFDLTVKKLTTYNNNQTPQLAFTNAQILKNIIFQSPVDFNLLFSKAEIKDILKDKNKGQTGIMHESDNLKTMNFNNFKFLKTLLTKNMIVNSIKILINKT